MVKKLELENAALKAGMENVNQNQTVENHGMLAMMKQLEIMGASMSSDYKPAPDTPAFNSSQTRTSKTDNCVTDIKDREKTYKGYKEPTE